MRVIHLFWSLWHCDRWTKSLGWHYLYCSQLLFVVETVWRVVTNITLTRLIYYLLQQEVNSLQHRAQQWHGEVLRSWWKVMLLSWYWWRPLCDTDHARDTLSPLNTSQLCRQQKIFDQDHNMVVMKNLIEECLIRLDDEVGLTINLAAECWSVGTKSDIKYLTHCCVTLII